MSDHQARAQSAAPNDPLGAFRQNNHASLEGAAEGPLHGLTFVAKDVFDVAGSRTGAGHPDWLQTHPPAEQTAPAVEHLVAAGASLVGKTHSDELCYSLTGENIHYGTPLNPKAPDRIPGGSSNGSAAAVAGELVDFALGTDCGGSVRVPASYCGLFGIRPTHGSISLSGIFPFSPSFDTVGWFTRSPRLLARVGRVVLDDEQPAGRVNRLIMVADAFEMLGAELERAFEPAIMRIADVVGTVTERRISPGGLHEWRSAFQTIQAAEVWQSLGRWIETNQPAFGPGIKERFSAAAAVTPSQVDAARRKREEIREHLDDILEPGSLLCLPTTPRAAPLRDSAPDDVEIEYRNQAMSLLCIAGLGGLPQISLPIASIEGLPIGLSLVGRRGTDVDLLTLAELVCP